MRVKFYDKNEPTTTVRIGRILMIIGGLPIALEFLLMSLANGQSLEMQIAWLNVLPDFFPIPMIGLIILLIGWLLFQLKWRKGQLHLTDNSLTIESDVTVIIPYDSNIQLYKLNKHRKQLRIKSRIYSSLTLKFDSEEQNNNITEKLEDVI